MKYSSKSQAENGMDNTTIMTPLRVKQSILVNSPTAPTQLQADWNETDSTKLSYIKNKPLVPSKTSELQNDSGFVTSADVPTKTSDLTNDGPKNTTGYKFPTINATGNGISNLHNGFNFDFSTGLSKPEVKPVLGDNIINSAFAYKDDLPQVETMPTATSSLAGKILQYVGTTTQDYTTGYFYECVNDGGTYTWEQINVQPSAVGDNGVPRYYLDCDGSSYNKMTTANKPVILAILNYYLSHNNQLPFVFFRKSGNDYKEVHSIKYQTYSASYSGVTFTIADNLHYASNSSYGVSYYTYYKSGYFTIYVRPSEWDNRQLTEVSFTSDWSDTSGSLCTPSGLTSIGVLPRSLSVLGTSNTSSYTPTGDYNPATKKYVDDSVPSNTSELVNDGETGSLKYLEKDETNSTLWHLGVTNDGHLYYESGDNHIDLTLANLSDVGESNTIVLEYEDSNFLTKMQDATTNGKAVFLHYPSSITQTLTPPSGSIPVVGGTQYNGQYTTFVLSNVGTSATGTTYVFSTPVTYITNSGQSGYTYYQLKVINNHGTVTWDTPEQKLLQAYIDDLASIRSGAALGRTAVQPGDNVSDLVNDAGYLTSYTETDPVFTASPAHGITSQDIANWNAAQANVQSDWLEDDPTDAAFILNKPSIPVNTSDLNNDSGFISQETDPVFSNSAAGLITASDLNNWNGKQDELVSGNNIKTINNTSLLGSGNINIDTGHTFYFDGQNTPANVAMINQICDAYDGGAEINFTGKFADYETGQIFQAPINVVKYTDAEMNTWCSFVSDPVAWFDDSVTPATTYYLTFALYLEGTWGEFTSVSEFRLDTMTPEEWSGKQDLLVSGTNIKTINNQSLLGSGNLSILSVETDPIFEASPAAGITAANITAWNSAEANVQSDWSQSDNTKDDYIKNKPTIPTVNNGTLTIQKNGTTVKTFTANSSSNVTANITVPTKTSDLTNDDNVVKDASYVHTDNNYTTTEKNKLSGIAEGAEVNVQSDWAQTDNTKDDYIKSKPTLATVATSGSYNDLSNKPTIPTVNNATLTIQKEGTSIGTFTANASTNKTINVVETDPVFAASAAHGITSTDITNWNNKSSFSGDYNDLTNKPTIPSKTSDLTNDSNFVADASYVHTDNNYTSTEKNKLSGIAAGAEVNVQSDWNVTDNTSDAYIKNKPTIPTVPTNISAFTNDAGYITTETDPVFSASAAAGITSGNITAWNAAEANVQSDWNVTDSASDAYIKNKPTIPTVNNGTLTIQKNGTTVQTFTANQSGNATANITVPTKVSDLTNDSGFLTSETDPIFSASAAAGITSSNISTWTGKQDALVSGTNIKTINNTSILGSGNIDIGGISTETDPVFEASPAATISNEDLLYWTSKQDELESGVNIKTINGYPILGPGDLIIGEGGVVATDVEINGVSITNQGSANIIVDGTYNPSTNKIATQSSVSEAIGDAIEEIDYVTYKVESFTNPILGTTSNVGVVTVGKPNNPIQIKLSNNVAKIRLNNNDVVYIGTDASGKSRIFANNMNALQNIKIGEFSWSKLSDGSIVFGGDE